MPQKSRLLLSAPSKAESAKIAQNTLNARSYPQALISLCEKIVHATAPAKKQALTRPICSLLAANPSSKTPAELTSKPSAMKIKADATHKGKSEK